MQPNKGMNGYSQLHLSPGHTRCVTGQQSVHQPTMLSGALCDAEVSQRYVYFFARITWKCWPCQ
jgi:hypothetical protein